MAGGLGAALLAQGCAGSISTPYMAEGEEYMRAASRGAPQPPVQPLKPTESIRSLALLTATDEQPYQPRWNPRSAFKDSTTLEGMGMGFYAGLNLLSVLPLFVATPVVIGGIIGLATAAGAVAGAGEAGKGSWKPPADHAGLETALTRLRPETEVRESFRKAVERITGGRAAIVTRPAGEPKNQPPDYGALAKAAGADAVADLRVVAFGLAGGEMNYSLAVFAGVRARVFRASDGALIYDKIVAQSPDVPLPDVAPPASYTLELQAMDDGRVFRHEMRQALAGIAHAIAADPDLRLASAAAAPPPAAQAAPPNSAPAPR